MLQGAFFNFVFFNFGLVITNAQLKLLSVKVIAKLV